MNKKQANKKNNREPFKMNGLRYDNDYLGKEENVFNNPEKFGFATIYKVYGKNRSLVTLKKEDMFGYFLGDSEETKIIIKLPDADNLIIVYNKHREDEFLQEREKYSNMSQDDIDQLSKWEKFSAEMYTEDKYRNQSSVVIPEKNLTIYTCCIFCRFDENGGFASVENEDFKTIKKYLAEKLS